VGPGLIPSFLPSLGQRSGYFFNYISKEKKRCMNVKNCSGSCDPGSRCRLCKRVYLVLGNPRGSGLWNEEYMGWSGEMGRSVYKQPGTEADRILSRQGGFQVSKGK
jgi:hypothetical protein